MGPVSWTGAKHKFCFTHFLISLAWFKEVETVTQIEREFLHGQKSTLIPTLGSGESWVEIRHLQKAMETLCAHPRV